MDDRWMLDRPRSKKTSIPRTLLALALTVRYVRTSFLALLCSSRMRSCLSGIQMDLPLDSKTLIWLLLLLVGQVPLKVETLSHQEAPLTERIKTRGKEGWKKVVGNLLQEHQSSHQLTYSASRADLDFWGLAGSTGATAYWGLLVRVHSICHNSCARCTPEQAHLSPATRNTIFNISIRWEISLASSTHKLSASYQLVNYFDCYVPELPEIATVPLLPTVRSFRRKSQFRPKVLGLLHANVGRTILIDFRGPRSVVSVLLSQSTFVTSRASRTS